MSDRITSPAFEANARRALGNETLQTSLRLFEANLVKRRRLAAEKLPEFDALRDAVRIDGTVTDTRLTHAAINAISSVNKDLSTWRQAQITAGAATLDDVADDEINGDRELKQLYLRAVYATTKANLIERYRDYDATGDGHKSADKLELSADDLYRDARFAIRDIIGESHTTVELI